MESIVRLLREKHRYTQTGLAEELGISRQALIKYENMELDLPLSVVRPLSKIFNVSYECLIDNCLPEENSEKDIRLQQIIHRFPKLEEHEKRAVSEMVRIMAESK
ncbi:MAG: helix-turn-helix transcriptional regulator [Treponema sp.]|nr:helix-turn-helix transcriptional regulator [Treponema sp.]